ncbi:MAG: hypothetical protein J6Y29_02705 [Clostridiales bacterium]|nr:hypothetical protein [Clostridiales bacterium]
MDERLLLRSYSQNSTKVLDKNEERGTKDPELSKGFGEIIDTTSKLSDALAVLGYVESLPRNLKIFKLLVDTFRLGDDVRKVRYVGSRLENLEGVKKVLDESDDERYAKKYDYKNNKFKYFYSDYDEYKDGLRRRGTKYILNKWDIRKLEKELSNQNVENREIKEKEVEKLKDINSKLEKSISRKQKLRERVINSEAININKHSSRRLRWKFAADALSFVANVIEVFTFPVVAAYVCATKVPGAVYGICRKIYINKFNSSRDGIGIEKVKDDYILTTLQLPALVTDFWSSIDKWILKKFREKSEKERKEEVAKAQLDYISQQVEGLSEKIKEVGKDDDSKKKFLENLEKAVLLGEKRSLEEAISRLEEDREIFTNEDYIDELNKDIEKQKKKLRKIEDKMISKTGRGAEHDKYTEEVRGRKLTEAINEIVSIETKLEVGGEGLDKVRKAVFDSKKTEVIIGARPRDRFLRMFNIRTMEDEDRMKSTAKFIVSHIRNLPDYDNLDENEAKEFKTSVDETKKSYKRIEKMLKTINIDDGNAFINKVRDYKREKAEGGSPDKNSLIDELVEAMKKEI